VRDRRGGARLALRAEDRERHLRGVGTDRLEDEREGHAVSLADDEVREGDLHAGRAAVDGHRRKAAPQLGRSIGEELREPSRQLRPRDDRLGGVPARASQRADVGRRPGRELGEPALERRLAAAGRVDEDERPPRRGRDEPPPAGVEADELTGGLVRAGIGGGHRAAVEAERARSDGTGHLPSPQALHRQGTAAAVLQDVVRGAQRTAGLTADVQGTLAQRHRQQVVGLRDLRAEPGARPVVRGERLGGPLAPASRQDDERVRHPAR
jgi:hypothetical protein